MCFPSQQTWVIKSRKTRLKTARIDFFCMRKTFEHNRMRTNWLRTKREIDQGLEPLAVKKTLNNKYENLLKSNARTAKIHTLLPPSYPLLTLRRKEKIASFNFLLSSPTLKLKLGERSIWQRRMRSCIFCKIFIRFVRGELCTIL